MIETVFLDAVGNKYQENCIWMQCAIKIKRIAKLVIENEVRCGSAAMVFCSVIFGSSSTNLMHRK